MSRIAFVDVSKVINDGLNTYQYDVYLFNKKGKDIEFVSETNLDSEDIKSVDVFYINLSIDILDLRIIRLPNLDTQKIRQVVPFELEGKIMVKRQDLIFDIVRYKDEDTFVAYIDKNELYSILQPLRLRGIIPQTITSIDIRRRIMDGMSDASNIGILSQLTVDDRIEFFKKEILSPTIQLKDRDITGEQITMSIIKPFFRAGFVVIFLIILWVSFKIYSNSVITSEIKASISRHYKTLFPQETKITDEVYQLRSKVKVLQDKYDAIRGVDALLILKNISELKIQGIILQEISMDKDVVRLKGEAQKVDDIERFKTNMKWARNVVVSDINQVEGRYLFNATIKI
ncbi:MAG: hypothetical protein N3A62_06005 [Thermodesulfovibrionales bacterium]|nr:hypothetical protein [Thermodesulfovibrionales bacterium]